MSGGSYEYLYCKEAEDFLSPGTQEILGRMVARLRELEVPQVADCTERLLLSAQSIGRMIDRMGIQMTYPLREVWKAVEMLDSHDWGPESVDKAYRMYLEFLDRESKGGGS
jgi:hypothetical protein